jgi:hypothetical protein
MEYVLGLTVVHRSQKIPEHTSALPVVYGPFVSDTMLLWAFNILVREYGALTGRPKEGGYAQSGDRVGEVHTRSSAFV